MEDQTIAHLDILEMAQWADRSHHVEDVVEPFGAVVHLVQRLEVVDKIHDDADSFRAHVFDHLAVDFRRSHDSEGMGLDHYGDAFGLGLGGDLAQGLDQALVAFRLRVFAARAVGAGRTETAGADQAIPGLHFAHYFDAPIDFADHLLAQGCIRIEEALAEAEADLDQVHCSGGESIPDFPAFGGLDIENFIAGNVEIGAGEFDGADGFEIPGGNGAKVAGQHAADSEAHMVSFLSRV